MSSEKLVVWVIAGGLLAAAMITIGFVLRRERQLLRELGMGAERLLLERDDAQGLAALLQAHRVRITDDARWVLSRSLVELRRDYVDGALAHARSFWFGSLLTGIALICTFGLIAYVMTGDVSAAIGNEAAQNDPGSVGTSHLASAVATLGGKFWISAAGVGGSVLSLFFANLARARIYAAAEHPSAALRRAFASLEEVQVATQRELAVMQGAQLEAQREQLAAIRALADQARRLNSIEVSVQAIGNEVSANLRHIMKDAMAEELRAILADTMGQVAEIAGAVQRTMTDAFHANLESLGTQLQASLTAVQRAIEGQAQGQLEQILGKMQDAFSGGFHSESQRMTESLSAFARVVPALEQQLRQMTGEIAEESRRRNAEASEASQQVLSRVAVLVDGLGAQQAASASAIERMQVVAEQGAAAMARQLEASSTSVVSQVLSASRAEVEAIASHLQAATSASAANHDEVASRVRDAVAAMAQATDGLAGTARTVQDMAGHTQAVLQDARRGSEATHAAARQLTEGGTELAASIALLQNVVNETRSQTQEQQALLLKQREYTKEVERLWPELFNTYLSRFQASSTQLGQSWKELHDRIVQVSTSIGATFADNVEALSASVDKLAHQANGRARS